MALTVRVQCGDGMFKQSFERWLEAEGLQVCEDGGFHLLVDRPAGWLILEHSSFDFGRSIILSDNLCPSYQLDLLDKRPAALVRLANGDELLPALELVQAGRTIYPNVTTPLTPTERKTLRLVAFGYTNLEIADARDVTVPTVKRSLHEIYRKLNLCSRVEATHYYLDNWHLIRNWQKPPFVT